MVAAMVFNGHTQEYIDSIDEELFSEIQVMFADGMLGNKGIFDALGPVTTAVFNYMRPQNAAAYRQDQIFPCINEYANNPDFEQSPTDAVNSNLLGYVMNAKGFKPERFKHG